LKRAIPAGLYLVLVAASFLTTRTQVPAVRATDDETPTVTATSTGPAQRSTSTVGPSATLTATATATNLPTATATPTNVLVSLPIVVKAPPMPTATNTTIPTPTATIAPPTPTDAPSATATPEPTVLPSGVFLRGIFTRRTTLTYRVFGELYNNSGLPIYSPWIEARYYSADGRLLAIEDGYALVYAVHHGMTSPFEILLVNAPAEIDYVELSGSSYSSSVFTWRNLTIASYRVTGTSTSTVVSGQVRNDYFLPIRSVRVIATFYDDQRRVVGTGITYVDPSTVVPGQSVPFRIDTGRAMAYPGLTVNLLAEGYE
jgi:hypothetical protein